MKVRHIRTSVLIIPIFANNFWSSDDSLHDILLFMDKKSEIVIWSPYMKFISSFNTLKML